MFLLTYYPLIKDLLKIACSMTSDLFGADYRVNLQYVNVAREKE